MTNSEELERLREEVIRSRLPLHETATNVVMGKGSPEAKIVFVGESPGRNEDLQGMPFVGGAGKNLDKLLEKVGLSPDEVYIANILKYRPPENRDPLPEEIKAHTPYLVKQIKIIQPAIICSLGNYATKFFLAEGNADRMNEQPGITSIHGKVRVVNIDGMKIKLIPLFHPAAIIYNRKLTELWEADMKVVKKEVSQKTLF